MHSQSASVERLRGAREVWVRVARAVLVALPRMPRDVAHLPGTLVVRVVGRGSLGTLPPLELVGAVRNLWGVS